MGKQKFKYKVIASPNHPKASNTGYIYEHVYVAEQILGRQLTDNEVVHHIDKNTKNNNPDNLMIFATNADHNAYHKGANAWSNDGLIWYASRKVTYKKCAFCNKYFPIKRRGLLTSAEMKMCGYFLKWFGLSAEVVTESRLRQFRMKFDQVSVGSISVLPINGKDVKVQWEFVKYKDWKDGKINPLKKEIEPLKTGEPIYFPPDLDGKDLLKR